MLASVIANSNRGKGQKAYEAADFLPKWERKAESQELDGEAMLRVVKSLNRSMGGGTVSGNAG